LLNGFGYALFGILSSDLETTWHDVTEFGESQNLATDSSFSHEHSETAVFAREISKRKFAKTRLFTGGRILHIIRRKKT
jgi:sn1-specific diacylglycerol lipase